MGISCVLEWHCGRLSIAMVALNKVRTRTLVITAIALTVMYAVIDSSIPRGRLSATSSEVGFSSESPAGPDGGRIIPASCESGQTHSNTENCDFLHFTAGSSGGYLDGSPSVTIPYGGTTMLNWSEVYGSPSTPAQWGEPGLCWSMGGAWGSGAVKGFSYRWYWYPSGPYFASTGHETIGPLYASQTLDIYCTITWADNVTQNQTKTVTINVQPLNGACATTHYECSAGTSQNQSSAGQNWTWSCAGANGGTTASCSEPKGQSCAAEYFCSGQNRMYRNTNCSVNLVEQCASGCTSGSCNPPPTCTPQYFCSNGNRYYRDVNCVDTLYQNCPNGCSGTECNPSCSPLYYCTGNDLYYRNSSCQNSLVQTCAYGCASGACQAPQPPTGTFSVTPLLVRSGESVTVSWNIANAQSCSVTGENGDSWSGTSGSRQSSAIRSRTTYSIYCEGLEDASPPSFSDSETVNLIPQFQEQ